MSRYDTVFAERPVATGHGHANLSRYRRGMTPIRPPRPLYGWRWTCQCGATGRVNGHKAEAVREWRSHRITEPTEQIYSAR